MIKSFCKLGILFSFLVCASVCMGEEALYDQAVKYAREHKQPLVVVFGAKWCPACQKLKTTLAEHREMTKEMTLLIYDVDEPEGKIVYKMIRDTLGPQAPPTIPLTLFVEINSSIKIKKYRLGNMSKEEFAFWTHMSE